MATRDLIHPVLNDDQIETIAGFGSREAIPAGRDLFRSGDDTHDMYVVLSGVIGVISEFDSTEELVIHHTAGEIVGEFDLMTGQRTYLGARALLDSEVIAITPAAMRLVIATAPTLGDVIVETLVARRDALLHHATRAIQVAGSRLSSESLALREYLQRNRLPHRWIDDPVELDRLGHKFEVRNDELPAALIGHTLVRNATPATVGEHLGLTVTAVDRRSFDLVVVGTGPAGLAVAVYGASEGLDTLAIESVAPGGQAGTSSRIENYLGFPSGVSGGELANLAMTQALKFGATFSTPCRVSSVESDDGIHVVVLGDGTEISTAAVVAASGAAYRRLGVPRLEEFEGKSIYYAATEVEARLVSGSPVVVVGGGNSAGQAALFLAGVCSSVVMVVRGEELGASMSSYLADRIAADPNIDLRIGSEVTQLHGDSALHSVTVSAGAEESVVVTSAVFSFIGASPSGCWLPEAVETDDHGFVLTDRDVCPDGLTAAWTRIGRLPLPFETSVPGIFAVGDVRAGSIKRVASAVGEGSASVRSVHQHLDWAT